MTDPRWRWHPITRVVAGILGLGMLTAALVALIGGAESLWAGEWLGAVTMLVALPAGVLGRLFLLGAWTGEEPAVRFDDDEIEADERVT